MRDCEPSHFKCKEILILYGWLAERDDKDPLGPIRTQKNPKYFGPPLKPFPLDGKAVKEGRRDGLRLKDDDGFRWTARMTELWP